MNIQPVWISGYFEHKEDAAQEAQQGIDPRLAEALPTAALTLDQIEAWLKNQLFAVAADGLHVCIYDLLAQVQAWKEGV